MAVTKFGTNDPKTIKNQSLALSAQTFQQSFIGKNLMSTDGKKPIHRIMKLERDAGDSFTVDLFNNLVALGVDGEDAELKGTEERLVAATMEMSIDMHAKGVNLGGKMTQKRIKHDLRSVGREKLSIYWSRLFDEQYFVYQCGHRGDETGDWLLSPGIVTPGTTKLFAGNTVQSYNTENVVYADPANNTADNNIAAAPADYMTLELLDYLSLQLKLMKDKPNPIMVGNKPKYIIVMHPVSSYQLRTTSGSKWIELLKNTSEGVRTLFSGALVEYDQFILYEHNKIPVVNNASSVGVCYNTLMGAQAGFLAHGNAGNGLHFDWHEETDDRGRKRVIDTEAVYGFQRSRYNSKEFASMLIKTTYNGAAS